MKNKNQSRPINNGDGWQSGDVYYVRIQGVKACWSRPEFKTSRVSSLIPSYSAANGLLSAFLSHKGVSYSIEKLGLLTYPQIINITTNEIGNFGTGKRTPIKTSALFDVDYWMSFRLRAPSFEEVRKYSNMLEARLPLIKSDEDDLTRMGGIWSRVPYLGLREYTGKVQRVLPDDIRKLPGKFVQHNDGMKAVNFTKELGICFFGTDYQTHTNYFVPMSIEKGVVEYPSFTEVKNLNIKVKFA